MSRYYCPFCSPRYQYYKTRSDGSMVCGHCGDDLTKAPLIRITQVIGFVGASAFLLPLLLMIVLLVQNLKNERINNSSDQIALLSLTLDDGKY